MDLYFGYYVFVYIYIYMTLRLLNQERPDSTCFAVALSFADGPQVYIYIYIYRKMGWANMIIYNIYIYIYIYIYIGKCIPRKAEQLKFTMYSSENGVSTNGVSANFVFFWQRDFWGIVSNFKLPESRPQKQTWDFENWPYLSNATCLIRPHLFYVFLGARNVQRFNLLLKLLVGQRAHLSRLISYSC